MLHKERPDEAMSGRLENRGVTATDWQPCHASWLFPYFEAWVDDALTQQTTFAGLLTLVYTPPHTASSGQIHRLEQSGILQPGERLQTKAVGYL